MRLELYIPSRKAIFKWVPQNVSEKGQLDPAAFALQESGAQRGMLGMWVQREEQERRPSYADSAWIRAFTEVSKKGEYFGS